MSKLINKRNINGILLLNKPLGISSNQALQKAKRLFAAKKAGHTGSLDPLASGMLPICFGEATKFSQFLLDSDKSYEVVAKLGEKTTTGDAEGEVIATSNFEHITLDQVEQTVSQFIGEINQVPPMFSAIKQNGKPLYELARKGIEVERKSRLVKIYDIRIKSFENDSLSLSVSCSKGTYIRTLVEDIAIALDTVAHVIALDRSMVEPFGDNQMFTLEELDAHKESNDFAKLDEHLLPIDFAIKSFPEVELAPDVAFYFCRGQEVHANNLPKTGMVRIYANDSNFLGIGQVTDDGRLAPKRLVATLSIE